MESLQRHEQILTPVQAQVATWSQAGELDWWMHELQKWLVASGDRPIIQ
jgi:hypothetical protein